MKNLKFTSKFLMILPVYILLLGIFFSCGKKDEQVSDSQSKKDDNKIENLFSKDKPFMVEFEITGSEKGKGTVKAIYDGKKCRSESSFDADGKKITSTAYFDGGDIVYSVTEVGGMKMGMKFDKNKFSESKDNIDVNSFRDYIEQMDKIGEEEILGYKCEIYKHKEKNFTVSLYEKTVPLRMGTADGNTVMKAIKFEKDYKTTDDMFTAPKDVKYVDMTNMLEEMNKLGNMKDNNKKLEELKDKTKELEDVMKNYKK